ncbi:MAG: PAS domain S-box protein [Candidatus Accumulibacter phosphatis]|uniref:histidine kinase n=3 Tax=Candidatus Accumulibacter TaxID=327159 RepID=A0A080MBW1_9PROT|nr:MULTISPECIES: PAS domain-containing sensor histidine kinase [Candidatus Accumulibacter]KFB78451.1 MAG: Sensor protein FixL [Candidatus Accumulibacter cognatus]MCC2866560.1 PAS domain S-box protein [Candidatus Accumulibacter phosphatis]MCM8624173.1 PAS domain S-box protein [Accumulibacter sp.]MCQ1548021.1 PAS domain S-box protein [Candidatus Accumulibacter phosphatis]TMQ78469.1 two-component hybrid sensor and regulator [Candidatus Accumulibacter phosphatis]
MKELALSYQYDRRRPTSLKWSNWYLSILKLAVGLLLVLLIALLWLLHRNEVDDQRSTLIADVLWLEQSMRFHLEGNSEQLQQLALDLARARKPGEIFDLRARHILKNNPELRQLLWLDAGARILHGMPTQSLPRAGQETSGEDPLKRSIELARLGKPIYSDAYRTTENSQFEVYVPIFDDGHYRGILLGVYSLNGLLKQQIPWWFAEKYQVRIVDGNGSLLASKSKIDASPTTLSYPVSLDPPGYGMVLQVTVYRGADNLAQTLIATLIIILAAAVFWSLWAVRGLIQRRLFAEQALRSEYAFRKAMEDSLVIGMRARDLDGRVTYANPAFLQMVGFSAEELIGREPPMPYWAPEEMERTLLLNNRVLQGKAPHEGFEIRLMHKNGSRFDALIYEAPLIDADGRQTGWMGSIIDVTERKHAEELARQQQEKLQVTARLVTMGEMASTLAHELNQPLAAITSYNTGCLNKLESGNFTTTQLKEALGKLAVQAQRAGHIIRRVHDFVRKSEPKLAPCDLAEAVDDSIGFIEGAAKSRGVRIVREIQGMRPELLADQVMIEQVLLNLMRNGIEAMAEAPADRRRLTVKLSQRENQMEIRVIDHGPGIPPEIEEKLFTPLFSTKADGMGMGLNICRSIIEFHHGRLWVESNPEGGSIFVMTLPIGRQ